MKIAPSKLQLGPSVVFGGVLIEAETQIGDTRKTVFLTPTQKKLDAFLDFPTPSCRTDVQSIMGAVAQLKRWCPGIMLLSKGMQQLTGSSTPFHWNSDLQGELDSMKAALKEHIKLSPLDTSKGLLVWSDAASSEGMCYVIAQWRDPDDHKKGLNIISCDSTTFKKGKRSMNPFEAELAGVHWALTKEHYFTCGAPSITVFCDCEGLGRFLADDIEKIKGQGYGRGDTDLPGTSSPCAWG